ncbi:putative ATP-dependent protease [Pseudomonas aeruginosa]|nr:putative ATP-dependent protease [Pseudomonas aeruginosa]
MPDSVAAGLRLAPEELTRPFAPEQFAFDTTDDLEPFRGVLGQERAVEALQFGVAMPRPGYNVFVMGEPGTGRFSFVKRYLQAEGKRVATPSDWVYLNNFDEPREPRVIELPPGSATEFSADIDRLIDNLMSTFPAVFEHPAYQQKKNAVDRAFNQRYDRALDSVERRALEKDVALYRDSANVAFTPMKDGKALDEAEFAQLPEAERERFHKDIAALEEYLNEELASLPQWKRESSNQLRELNEETITLALQPLLAPLVEKYNNNPGVCAYLQAMQLNLLKTVVDQLVDDSRTDAQRKQGLIEQYAPNQAIVHHATSGAPVVFESHPTYDNLFGRIEYSSDQGALYTSYRQLRPGALHRANGGFLILEAEKMLGEPFVWDALKRALQSRQLKDGVAAGRTRPPGCGFPDPPGDPAATEGDHHRLAADLLHPAGPRSGLPGECSGYWWTSTRTSRWARTASNSSPSCSRRAPRKRAWRPLSGAAVARLATYSARLAEHQGRLSARIGDLFQLVQRSRFHPSAGERGGDPARPHRACPQGQADPHRTSVGADPRRHAGGDHPDRHRWRRGRQVQRTDRAGGGRLGVRRAGADFRDRLSGQQRHRRHRARGQPRPADPLQGRDDPHRLPG